MVSPLIHRKSFLEVISFLKIKASITYHAQMLLLTFDIGNMSTPTKSILLIQNANEQHTGIYHCAIQNNETLQSYMTSTTVLLMPGSIYQLTFTYSKSTIEILEKVRNIFKVNNKHSVNDVSLVFLLLTFNIFHTLFWCFYC